MRIYAIGDIHGQLAMLEAMHDRVAKDRAATGDQAAPVVHLGDYVDRGPDSRGVLQRLIDGVEEGQPWVTLRGNHDEMFLDYLRQGPEDQGWNWFAGNIGGRETLASYGVASGLLAKRKSVHRRACVAVPDAHRAFLEALPLSYETADLIFVHAGIRPGLPLSDQIPQDLLWIRGEFLSDPRDHGRIVVHGHTIVPAPEHRGNRVALDTGAGMGNMPTVAVFEGTDVHILEETGRRPLRP
ncbi:MAG: metallophosphoesterase family protein [Pseudomonadota bacterium]